jgi:hypothetical protein
MIEDDSRFLLARSLRADTVEILRSEPSSLAR